MAKFESYEPGQFSWVDLMARDTDAAIRFYGALFGWSHSADQDGQGRPYTMFSSGGVNVAGMGAMDDAMQRTGMPPVWSSYVTVADLEATTKRAVELGGQVMLPPMAIPPAGAMAILTDPEGAAISLWTPQDHIGAGITNVPGSFCWNELTSRVPDDAQRFYGDLFGWSFQGDDYREVRVGDRMNGGILPWREEMGDQPANWKVYFAVEDCDGAVARCQELSGQLLMGPVDIEPGRFAVVSDDQGAIFNVMKLNAAD